MLSQNTTYAKKQGVKVCLPTRLPHTDLQLAKVRLGQQCSIRDSLFSNTPWLSSGERKTNRHNNTSTSS